jgi:ADP-ribose pyrophosphatase YjhB (NUDIX family)
MKYGTMTYLNCDKGILMLRKIERKEDPNSGYCTLPGGKIENCEKGKNIEGRIKSSIRETGDETGIFPINPILRGVILFDNKDRTFDNWPNPDNFLVQIYSATKYYGELRASDEGIPFWVSSWEEINSLPKNAGDKKMYEWLKDGRNFSGVIKHKGNEIDEDGTWGDYFLSKIGPSFS